MRPLFVCLGLILYPAIRMRGFTIVIALGAISQMMSLATVELYTVRCAVAIEGTAFHTFQ